MKSKFKWIEWLGTNHDESLFNLSKEDLETYRMLLRAIGELS